MSVVKYILMLLACGQFTVDVIPRTPRFSVEVTRRVDRTKTVTRTVTKTRKPDYVIMFSSPSCVPCQTWKRTEKSKLTAKGIPFREINMAIVANQTDYRSIVRYPTFRVYNGETSEIIRQWVGSVDSETLASSVTSRTKIRSTPRKTVERTVTTETGMTHADRVRLHNRLHGGGSWTWPGNLEQHLRQVHGVETR